MRRAHAAVALLLASPAARASQVLFKVDLFRLADWIASSSIFTGGPAKKE